MVLPFWRVGCDWLWDVVVRSRLTGLAPPPLAVRSTGGRVAQHSGVHAGTVAGAGDGELGDGVDGHGWFLSE